MTKELNDKSMFSDFSIWMNENEELDSRKSKIDIQNVDYMVHKYDSNKVSKIKYFDSKVCKFLMIEEKTHLAKQSYAQKDTHTIIDQVMHNSSGRLVDTGRGDKVFKYYGYHIIKFENTSPDNGKFYVDGEEFDKNKLIKFLKFELPEEEYKCYYHPKGYYKKNE